MAVSVQQSQSVGGSDLLSEPLLEIRNLVKRFPNGHVALNDVSLSVHTGELTVVLGANGSGKSTMLRCAVRLIDPTDGSVLVGGSDLAHLSGQQLRQARMAVAMIFQHANLVRRRTAVANVATGALGRCHNWKTAFGHLPKEELSYGLSLLERVGLAHLASQRADTLSGGQAQRVAIARGLCQRPRVVLADEPVASLDPEAAEEVMLLLGRLATEERLGVICVLHQPELALRHAHRIVGLREGRVLFDQATSEVSHAAIADLYRSEAA